MKDIKLIMVDIDGTLLNSHNETTPKTIEAISKLREHGVMFGIATGRTPVAVEKLLPLWGIEKYVDVLMGFNGGMYFDYILNQTIASNVVDGQILKDVIEEYSKFDVSFGIFDGMEYHVTREDEVGQGVRDRSKLTLVVDDLKQYIDSNATKMLIMGEEPIIDEVEKYHNEHPDSRFKGVRSTKFLFEILEPNLSKSMGIEKIATAHGFTLDNVCVFGDELNDLEMIRDCGVGVCMGNGNPKLKEIADYVTDSNNEDGIATFINKYIIQEA